MRAYRYGLERIERPAAWLLVVGGREAIRHRRRRRREEPLPEREPGGATFEAAAERAELLAALRRLPERQLRATLHQALMTLREWQLAGKLARGATR